MGKVRWWVPGAAPFSLEGFDGLLAAGRVVKDYRLKKTVECEAGGRVWLVKIYKSGGTLRRLKTRLLGSRARHELRMYEGVVKRGIPTVPLAAVGERGTEGYVVCEKLEGWRSLESALLDSRTPSSERRRLLREYGRFARTLHDAGIWQYDFNASNILVDPAGRQMKVIDFELMKLRRSIGEESRLRTLAKMNRIPRLSRADRIRFLREYFASRDLRPLLKRLSRRIGLQAVRDAERFGRNCTRENRNFARLGRGWYRKRRESDEGLTLEEAQSLAAGNREGYRLESVPEPIAAWREANVRAKSGGPTPVAVIVERKSGWVAYRKAGDGIRTRDN